MITQDQTASYRAVLDGLRSGALVDLRSLLAEVSGMDPTVARGILTVAFPELFDPYMNAASDVSAQFYEEMRTAAGVKKAYTAQSLAQPVAPGRWGALAGWGARPAMMEQGAAVLLSAFSGALSRMVTTTAGDTIHGNAAADSEIVGYQRVPSPGCCAFCGMLASRGAAYGSQESALGVVGRGVPVPKVRGGRGRPGGGIKARGSRGMGERYHDFCECTAVPVFGHNYVEMQEDADKYYNAYRDSADKVNAGLTLETVQHKAADGSLKNKYQWVSPSGPVSSEQNTKNILAAMRQDLGVK